MVEFILGLISDLFTGGIHGTGGNGNAGGVPIPQ